jgi:hypothetical protein
VKEIVKLSLILHHTGLSDGGKDYADEVSLCFYLSHSLSDSHHAIWSLFDGRSQGKESNPLDISSAHS